MPKKIKEPAPAEEPVYVEPATEALAEVDARLDLSESAPIPSPKPAFGQRVKRFLAFLLRLTIVLFLAIALGVGLYFGLPILYEKYILPVQENTEQLAELKTDQSQSELTLTDLQTRLAVIETQQAQNAASLAGLDGRMQEVEAQIAAHTKSLAELDKTQSALTKEDASIHAELERQIKLLKAMELLSRARLFLYQSNYGLARQDILLARDLLISVQSTATDDKDNLAEVVFRLDRTLSNLPNFPVAASDDLDIAWNILLGGLPQAQATATFVNTPELIATPTPQATIESTPTP